MSTTFKPGDRVRVKSWVGNEDYEVINAYPEGDREIVVIEGGSELFANELELVSAALDPLPRQFRAGVPVSQPMSVRAALLQEPFYLDDLEVLAEALDGAAVDIHAANVRAGWWSDPATGEPIERNVGEMLMLCVTELAEAMEGHRKGLRDDKLPQYPMLAVELADTVIRILDLAGAMQIDIGEIVAAKARFNITREDHKPENRLKEGGKSC